MFLLNVRNIIFLFLLLWSCAGQTRAQSVFSPTDVFLQRTSGVDTLIFVNHVTGEETRVEVDGERYTLLDQAVMYFDRQTRRVMLAEPDGSTRQHRFIQMEADSRRIDWLVSPDKQQIIWTLTTADAGQLSTVTRLLSDTADIREVFRDGPRTDGLRALPVAFNADYSKLYMDYQPDGVEALTAFPQYAGLFEVNLENGQQRFLPGEPGDFTGAGFGAGLFLRLELTNTLEGFDVHAFNLITGFDSVIPALRLRGYTQAGDMLVAPNGKYAVYALSQITGFGTSRQSVRSVFVLVDLVTMTQSALTDPITTFVRPVAWTEDNSAVIFTSPQNDGTWKVNLQGKGLQKIATFAYLGTLD
jgi:hypothetical protein